MPIRHPRKPIGIETIAGLVSGNGAALSGPDQTCGDSTISRIDDTSPLPMPTTAPIVLKRRQVSDSSSGGKFADAATANVRPVSSWTLNVLPAPSASSAPTRR